MNTSELLKKVRKVEIRTRGLSQRLFSGEYQSAFKGRGMSFAEVRPYQFGDDVRTIDWNVTARYNEPYIKTFEEERELTVMLLIDLSRSDSFGSVHMLKSELITELAAVLSFSAIANNDKVGVIFFTDGIEQFIPPRKGRSHILRIIRELLDFVPKGKGTDLSGAFSYLNRVIKKRCITFVLSDFMTQNYDQALRIASLKHDLIGIHVFDPLEEELPKVGLLRVQDSETGQTAWLDTEDVSVRRAYSKKRMEQRKYFSESFRKNGADTIDIRTDRPYLASLHAFFKKRESRA